jgi:hypothetical protein
LSVSPAQSAFDWQAPTHSRLMQTAASGDVQSAEVSHSAAMQVSVVDAHA